MSKLKAHILVIEDDENLSQMIKGNLEQSGYSTQILSDGLKAIETIRATKPDLIILDWLLPGKSGLDICKEARKHSDTSNTPIIMISARGSDFEKVIGLDNGADDYLAKPFSPQELIARVKALLRRIRPVFADTLLRYRDIEIDPARYKASKNQIEVKLAPIEFQILQILLETPEKVVSRNTLMNKIWGLENYVEERTIDVHITRLRKALVRGRKVEGEEIIKTIRSVGYKLEIIETHH
jgi:two-component system phosphate regulon response regulator PhoB